MGSVFNGACRFDGSLYPEAEQGYVSGRPRGRDSFVKNDLFAVRGIGFGTVCLV